MSFADPIVVKQGNHYSVHHGDDSQTWVEFRKEAVYNEARSKAAGTPCYDDVDYIKMMFPGDKTKIPDRPVKDEDKERFQKQWRQYLETGAVVQEGTPITEWPPITKGEAMTLKGAGIHTVQALAAMSDHGLNVILGARELRAKAQAFLQVASGDNAVLSRLMAQVEQLAADNAALTARVAGMPPPEPKKKAGRPAKVTQ